MKLGMGGWWCVWVGRVGKTGQLRMCMHDTTVAGRIYRQPKRHAPKCPCKQVRLLRDPRHAAPGIRQPQPREAHAVHDNVALHDLVQPEQRRQEARLAAARPPHHADFEAGGDGEVHAVQDGGQILAIPRVEVSHPDFPPVRPAARRAVGRVVRDALGGEGGVVVEALDAGEEGFSLLVGWLAGGATR